MKLPTSKQTLAYFEQYHVPYNIKNHCLRVREVAVFLANALLKIGVYVNVELVDRTALMHDLFKVVVLEELIPSDKYHPEPYSEPELKVWQELRSKYPNKYESEVAYQIFKEEFPELAIVIKNSSDPRNREKTIEESIVHYADWRISGEKILPLSERLEYLKKRYPRDDGAWDKYIKVIKADEEKLFSGLDFTADDLAQRIIQEREQNELKNNGSITADGEIKNE